MPAMVIPRKTSSDSKRDVDAKGSGAVGIGGEF
jgi:hypothetical protein